jgi:hypothetical protein
MTVGAPTAMWYGKRPLVLSTGQPHLQFTGGFMIKTFLTTAIVLTLASRAFPDCSSQPWAYASGSVTTICGPVGIGVDPVASSLHVEKDQDSQTNLVIQNTSQGTAALEYFRVAEDLNAKQLQVIHLNSGYFSLGVFVANTGYVDSLDSGGLGLGARSTTGKIFFYTGGYAATNQRMVIDKDGKVGIGAAVSTTAA